MFREKKSNRDGWVTAGAPDKAPFSSVRLLDYFNRSFIVIYVWRRIGCGSRRSVVLGFIEFIKIIQKFLALMEFNDVHAG